VSATSAPEAAPAAEGDALGAHDEPVLLDTNVLVYASNADAPVHERARTIVERALAGELDAALTPQVLAEYLAVVTDPRRLEHPIAPRDAQGQVDALLDGPMRLLTLGEVTTRRLAELATAYDVRAQRLYDLHLVATMLAHGVLTIYTANVRDFRRYAEVTAVDPFA